MFIGQQAMWSYNELMGIKSKLCTLFIRDCLVYIMDQLIYLCHTFQSIDLGKYKNLINI